ncbi:hypothetical protein E2I00_017193, partial [Balaenoptera physalus]
CAGSPLVGRGPTADAVVRRLRDSFRLHGRARRQAGVAAGPLSEPSGKKKCRKSQQSAGEARNWGKPPRRCSDFGSGPGADPKPQRRPVHRGGAGFFSIAAAALSAFGALSGYTTFLGVGVHLASAAGTPVTDKFSVRTLQGP